MECFNRIPYSVKNLLFQLPLNCIVVCEEIISEKPNQETLQGVVFFLVESWDVVKRTKNDWNFLSNVCLSSVCVLEAVKRLRCEKLFSQVSCCVWLIFKV